MHVLDTDILSLLQNAPSPPRERVRGRLRASGVEAVITIVSVAEQLKGRLAQCAAARTPGEYVRAAALLRTTLDNHREWKVLDFDARAAAEYARLKAAKLRAGTNDLRIAAICLANAATLVTRNLADFRPVPGLRAEDWAA